MRQFIAALFLAPLLGLAACSQAPAPDAPGQSTIVGFDPARFAGSWTEAAATHRAPGLWQVNAGPDGQMMIANPDTTGAARLTGPGRFTIDGVTQPYWVLWVDADYRTVVLGAPGRARAIVLNRGGALPTDRARAVRDILDWNGYAGGLI